MTDTRERMSCIRFREREMLALDAALVLTVEPLSAFVRRVALAEARRLIEASGDAP